MAQITKHVGRHGDRKVAVIFREMPGEPHMCLIAYTQTLNRHIHDAIMDCINSDVGQQAENLADALNRVYSRDGKVVLHQLHTEGLLKKVQTELITMTPTTSNKHDVKLSDLNTIINKMNAGEEAQRELAEMEASRGLQDPADVARRMRESNKPAQTAQPVTQSPLPATQRSYRSDDMSDAAIAWRLRQQAVKMAAEGRGLLSESERMLQEAQSLDPVHVESVAPVQSAQTKTRTRKTAAAAPVEPQPVVAPAPAPKRGRPARAKASVQA